MDLSAQIFLSRTSDMFSNRIDDLYDLSMLDEESYSQSTEMIVSNNIETDNCKFVDVDNVRISPAMIVFKDAYEGKQFVQNITLQNIGKSVATVKIGQPTSWAFKMKQMDFPKRIYPGIKITKRMKYTHHIQDSVLKCQLLIRINDHKYLYQVRVLMTKASLQVTPKIIDFGVVNVGQGAVSREFTLSNEGQKTAKYCVSVSNTRIIISVNPRIGEITANSSQTLTMVLVAVLTEGVHISEVWFKSGQPLRVFVKVTAIVPKIELSRCKTTNDFTLIEFKPTYYNSESHDVVQVKNSSVVRCMFVLVSEVEGCLVTFKEMKKMNNFRLAFDIDPFEGIINPFETKLFKIRFKPKKLKLSVGWSNQEIPKESFLVFIRIINIDKEFELEGSRGSEIAHSSITQTEQSCTQMLLYRKYMELVPNAATPNWTATETELNRTLKPSLIITKASSVRLCLYGIGCSPEMEIEPNYLDFGQVRFKQTSTMKLLISNNNQTLPIHFKYIKVQNIEVEPKTGKLEALTCTEVYVKLTPTYLGINTLTLIFEAQYPIYHVENNRMKYVTIGKSAVEVKFSVEMRALKPKKMFNMGLTPMITHPVGFLTDDVTFRDKNVLKPRAAIIGIDSCPTHPNKKEDTCLIAFPNDIILTKKTTNQIRTIFTGLPRYNQPVDRTLVKTTSEIMKMQDQEYHIWEFIYNTNKQLRLKYPKKKQLDAEDDHLMQNILKMVENFTKCSNYEKGLLTRLKKMSMSPAEEPMTPQHLYNLRIFPNIINFGRMLPGTKCTEHIYVCNGNNMHIQIDIINNSKGIILPNGSSYSLLPMSSKKIPLIFQSIGLGHFNAILYYILNNKYELALSVRAKVTRAKLNFKCDEVNFGSNRSDDLFQLKSLPVEIYNPLRSPVNFKWDVPSESIYKIHPNTGEIPESKTIVCHVYRDMDATKSTSTEAKLIPKDGIFQILYISSDFKKPKVHLNTLTLNMTNVPLNILVQTYCTLINESTIPATFNVGNPNPIPGVTVTPTSGIIYGKSEYGITISFVMLAVLEFKFVVEFQLQSLNLYLTVSGDVEYPNVVIKPECVRLRRISVDSFDITSIMLENSGKSQVKIQIPMHDYPEFRISTSEDDFHKNSSISEIYIFPKHHETLYLHFTPVDVASYEFYLPIIINGIIGPALLDLQDSTKPGYFLDKHKSDYEVETSSVFLDLPPKMPLVKVDCTVAKHILTFSDLHIKFQYLPHPKYNNKTEHTLTITNTSRNEVKFLIRLDDLHDSPYTLECVDNNEVIFSELTLDAVLQSEKSMNILVSFKPTTPGLFTLKLPIFVRCYDRGTIFNYLCFEGEYLKANLTSSVTEIFCPSVPLNISYVSKFIITASYYHENSFIEAKVADKSLHVVFPEGNTISTDKLSFHIPVLIIFNSGVPISISEQIIFYNSLNDELVVNIFACADNCSITTYNYMETNKLKNNLKERLAEKDKASKICLPHAKKIVSFTNSMKLHEEYSNYPHFPNIESDWSEFANYMQKTLDVAETWLFERGLKNELFIKIPYGFHVMATKIHSKNTEQQGHKTKQFQSTFIVELLKSFAGSEIEKFFYKRPMSSKEDIDGERTKLERICYIYEMYTQMLKYLTIQGAFLAYIKPIFLLSYEDYVDYLTKIVPYKLDTKPNVDIVTKHEFILYCTQSWLDIVLQLFKIFSLSQVTLKPKKKQSIILSKYDHLELDPTDLLSKDYTIDKDIYNQSERILLTWLNEQYMRVRSKIWKSLDLPPRKPIKNFDKDLRNGHAFICVTAAYCSYLIELCFSDVYGIIKNDTMCYHNAARVIEAWRKLHLGISITPKELVETNNISMVMLVKLLYDTLPSLVPKETIFFTAELTKSSVKEISLASFDGVGYFLTDFILNDFGCFKVEHSARLITVKKQSTSVTIKYFAKKLDKVKAVLLFSGEVCPGVYTENLVFCLEGEPSPITCSESITVCGNLYENIKKPLTITPPYPEAAKYKIFRTVLPFTNANEYESTPWDLIKICKIPRVLYIESSDIYFLGSNVEPELTINATFNFFTNHNQTLWITLTNPDVGDFIIEIIIIVKEVLQSIPILLKIPDTWNPNECVCISKTDDDGSSRVIVSQTCPCIVQLPIPMYNQRMWDCFKTSFFLSMDPEEIKFWEEVLQKPLGLDLLKWMVHEDVVTVSSNILYMLRTSCDYTVCCVPENDTFKISPKIHIDDLLSHGYVNVQIHVLKLNSISIKITSEDENEIRWHNISFYKDSLTDLFE